jgi:TonB family protein
MILTSIMLATATPLGDHGAWISSDDYPIDALQNRVEGDVEAKLEIDRQGKATTCSVVASSGNVSLDDTTCRLLLERARFQPTQRKERQYFQTIVKWIIPATLIPIKLTGFTAFYNFKDGKPIGECAEEVIGQPDELLPLCEIMDSPEMMRKFGLNSLAPFSAMQLRMLFGPNGQISSRATGFDEKAQYRVLMKAHFEVHADGIAKNCAVIETINTETFGDICSVFDSDVAEFDVAGARQFPVPLVFIIDAFAK